MTDIPGQEALVAALIDLLDVEEIDTDLYRGRRQAGGVGRVFGGQVIAQALQSAQRSVDPPKVAHSLHAYFMRPGSEDHPIIYRVVRDFDGGSFATRRIVAIQRGQPILNMAASFHRPEGGPSHQDAIPDVPDPETLPDAATTNAALVNAPGLAEAWRARLLRPRPIELRPVRARMIHETTPADPVQNVWFRAIAPLGDDAAVHRAILAYASDMNLMGTAMLPHGMSFLSRGFQGASLDHALWLHEDFRADDWLLYAMDSPWAGHSRGVNRGRIFTRDGRLVASVAQEGLMRMREPK